MPRYLRYKYQIPIWYRYFLGIPNSWLPIDITSTHACTHEDLHRLYLLTHRRTHARMHAHTGVLTYRRTLSRTHSHMNKHFHLPRTPSQPLVPTCRSFLWSPRLDAADWSSAGHRLRHLNSRDGTLYRPGRRPSRWLRPIAPAPTPSGHRPMGSCAGAELGRHV